MATLLPSEYTTFTLDNMGRFFCNTLDEALDSASLTVGGRPRGFDVVVIGGGTFGSVVAQRLFTRDLTRSRRILVLESGPFVLPEHVQNLVLMGGTPDFRKPWVNDPQRESDLKFPGLLYAIGGRSLSWGGWSPELLHDLSNDEMSGWPASVIGDLQSKYFRNAADQLGVSSTNDFIYGPLHEGLRQQLFAGLQPAAGTASPPASSRRASSASRAGAAAATIPARSGPLGVLLSELPDHPIVRNYEKEHGAPPKDEQLRSWLNLPAGDTTPRADLLNLLKLEAPLAVQSQTEPGMFPFNKFSAVPLLMQAARIAATEADGTGPEADARKRLMVVPNCRVQELITETQPDNWVRVVAVRVVDATGATREVPLAPPRIDGSQSVAIIALGTVESTRVALTTFNESLSWRAAQRMGKNLMAHLRSNLTIRIPREALTHLPAGSQRGLQVSALFVKGKAKIRNMDRFFHLQITASGLSALGNNSEAELFRKLPDIDHVDAMKEADDTTVVITLRGIGEMCPDNPDSHVGLAETPGDVEFGRPKAYVNIGNAFEPSGSQQTQDDHLLWEAMDSFTNEVALIFAQNKPFEILSDKLGKTINVPAGATAADLAALLPHRDRRDGLGTTHHETGTLRMSDAPEAGVTNGYGRIHDTTNCYVASPALFPTIGSPNPMLTGMALARRTADMLSESVLPRPQVPAIAPGFTSLFDGSGQSFNRWSRTSPHNSNGFALVNGEIVTYGNRDFGLLYYAARAFKDFTLRVQFRILDAANHNSGVFVRFRNPALDPTPVILTRMKNEGNDFDLFKANRAWSAVHSGFEVQIDDHAIGDRRKTFHHFREEPNGLQKNRTGAIYKIPAGDWVPGTSFSDPQWQTYTPPQNLVPGLWYEFEIDVRGNQYTVDLTNLQTSQKVRTSTFVNMDPDRGVATENGEPAGFIGLQSYAGCPLAFRQILIRE